MEVEVIQQKPVLSKFLGDTSMTKVIEFLIRNPGKEFTVSEIANGAGIGRTTLWEGNLLIKMIDVGLVTKTREIGSAKLFKLNTKSQTTRKLLDLYHIFGGNRNVYGKIRKADR